MAHPVLRCSSDFWFQRLGERLFYRPFFPPSAQRSKSWSLEEATALPRTTRTSSLVAAHPRQLFDPIKGSTSSGESVGEGSSLLMQLRVLPSETGSQVEEFFNEKNIPLTNVVACATDGAASIVGRYRGFQAHLKSVVPGVMTVHCIIHRQHLVSKKLSGRLHKSLRYVINAVNKIKSNALNNRLFHKLCEENDAEFERLLLHTEVRWLSKGKCLRRFHELFDTVVKFLEFTDPSLSSSLKLRHLDVAYLADIFDKLNEVNIKLQGDKINFLKAKGVICSFISKLDLLASNMSCQELYQFPSLGNEHELQGEDLDVFCCHLKQLKEDMEKCF